MPKYRAKRDSFHDDQYYEAGQVYVFPGKAPSKHFEKVSKDEPERRQLTEAELMGMSKQTLLAVAQNQKVRGISMRTKKETIASMILEGGESPDEPESLQETANREAPAARVIRNGGKKGK